MISSIKNNRGMAFPTVLLLSLLGASIIIGLFYLSKNVTSIFGIENRYFHQLEDAKSIANYLARTIMSPTRDLSCGANGSKLCIPNSVIDCNSSSTAYLFIPPAIYDSAKHSVKACYLFALEDPNAVEDFTLHGFWIRVSNVSTGEKVDLDFVYKVK